MTSAAARLSVSLALFGLLGGAGFPGTSLSCSAQAQSLPRVVGSSGRAEVQQGNVWRPLSGTAALSRGVRTGAGRAELTDGAAGRILVGSSSSGRVYRSEFQAQDGQFYVQGPVQMYARGYHLAMDRSGELRIDLRPGEARVAVLRGEARLDWSGQVSAIQAGQQFNLVTGRRTPFQERDPWYRSRFTGEGEARVEALRGQVQFGSSSLRTARRGDLLVPGTRLNTGADSWAEVGFTGGGYLRLQESSELRVLSVTRTSSGREILMELTRGSAWNVVEPGRGGYRITTPVVSTAVRGTVYRVDASGLVKVFEGEVDAGGQEVKTGQQWQGQEEGQGEVVSLTPDARDDMNLALDAQRRRPLAVRWPSFGPAVNAGWSPQVSATPQSRAELVLRPLSAAPPAAATPAVPSASAVTTFELQAAGTGAQEAGAAGAEAAAEPEQGQDLWVYALTPADQARLHALPEGDYALSLVVHRYGEQRRFERRVTLDRTPPQLEWFGTPERRGRVMFLRGSVSDNQAGPLSLGLSYSWPAAGQPGAALPSGEPSWTDYRFWVSRPAASTSFELLVPAAEPHRALVTLKDQAGNVLNVALP